MAVNFATTSFSSPLAAFWMAMMLTMATGTRLTNIKAVNSLVFIFTLFNILVFLSIFNNLCSTQNIITSVVLAAPSFRKARSNIGRHKKR
jgi:hypothetical protein